MSLEAPTTPSDPDEPETPADNIENTRQIRMGKLIREEAVQTEGIQKQQVMRDLISRQQDCKTSTQIIDDFRILDSCENSMHLVKDDPYVRESIPEGIDGTADTSDESLKADKKAAKKKQKS